MNKFNTEINLDKWSWGFLNMFTDAKKRIYLRSNPGPYLTTALCPLMASVISLMPIPNCQSLYFRYYRPLDEETIQMCVHFPCAFHWSLCRWNNCPKSHGLSLLFLWRNASLNPLKAKKTREREREIWVGFIKSRFKEEIKGWSERQFIFRGGERASFC
jgi:hypothetical protein